MLKTSMHKRSDLTVKILVGISLLFSSLAWGKEQECAPILGVSTPLIPAVAKQVDEYLESTLNSLEKMRGKNGLLSDAIWVRNLKNGETRVSILNADTSLSNIAVDLLIQIELLDHPYKKLFAYNTLEKVISTLETLPYHEQTGLFYSRYSSNAEPAQVKHYDLSSIDSLHLAIALWTLHEKIPNSNLAARAYNLFQRMDFSDYFDPTTGLVRGNARFDRATGTWIMEDYKLGNMGSEGRLLYTVGFALGLFKKYGLNDAKRGLEAMDVEISSTKVGNILLLWDGSAFQLFFPRIFANDEFLSPQLAILQKNFAQFMVAEGERRNIGMPAAHSAARRGTSEKHYKGEGSIYHEKSGNLAAVCKRNCDANEYLLAKNWEDLFTPYAFIMAAMTDPNQLMPKMLGAAKISSGHDPLYHPNMGWMEGVYVQGPSTGHVVASQLSINQGMIALSLMQMQSHDRLGTSGRALYSHRQIYRRALMPLFETLNSRLFF